MKSRKKRAYVSETRHHQAAQTKERILEAAKALFQKKGFEGVTIDQLAEQASVSSPTIYALFQSKRGVLRALMDEALPLDQFIALVESCQGTTPQEHLQISAKMARQIYDAESSQMDIFRGASVLSPEFKELEKEREERRYIRQEETIKAIEKAGSLAKGLNISKARDILWSFTGRDMYRLFVVDRGWTSDDYEVWLSGQLIKTLLKES